MKFFWICLFSLSSAHAGLVTSSADDGSAGTLRFQIDNAPPNDIITFAVNGTIELNSPLIVTQPIFIIGPGQDNLTISGGENHRIMVVLGNTAVDIRALTIADGRAIGGDGEGSEAGGGGGGGSAQGGAIYSENGPLTFADVMFRNNIARGGNGGKTYVGHPNGSNNGAGGAPAGGYGHPGASGNTDAHPFAGSGGGPGILNGSNQGGGSWDGGFAFSGGNSLINQNDPTRVIGGGGGGGAGIGGAIYSSNGTVKLIRCVFEKNGAFFGKRGNNNLNDNHPGDSVTFYPASGHPGFSVFAENGNIEVVDEVTFGHNSRANFTQYFQFPSTPASFETSFYQFNALNGNVIRSSSFTPAADNHPQLDDSGSPQLPFTLRNQNNSLSEFNGLTVTQILQSLAGYQVVDANITIQDMGMAVVAYDDVSGGVWTYEQTPGVFVPIPAVSEQQALILDANKRIKFSPYPGFDTEASPMPNLSFRAWNDITNAGLIGTLQDATSNGVGTSFSENIGTTWLPIDESLKWMPQYLELDWTEAMHPEGHNPYDPEGNYSNPFRGLARMFPRDMIIKGNQNQGLTIVGVGGAFAAGPSVTSGHADYKFTVAEPGIVANGVLQGASIPGSTYDGTGSQVIFETPVVLHGQQQITANQDQYSVLEDTATELQVLANDSDPDLQPGMIIQSVLRTERGGTTSTNGTTVTYTPKQNFHGKDSFYYLVRSADAQRWGVGEVLLEVQPLNDAPLLRTPTPVTTINEPDTTTVTNVMIDATAGPYLATLNPGTDTEHFVTLNALGAQTFGTPEDLYQNLNHALTDIQASEFLTFSSAPQFLPGGVLSFTVAPDAYGSATVTFNITDDGASGPNDVNSAGPFTAELVVNPVNDAPTFSTQAEVDGTALVTAADTVLMIPNFVSNISLGPANESNQSILQFNLTIDSDPNHILNQAVVNEAGDLELDFTLNSGMATVMLTLQDDGGVANGGQDTSAVALFNIIFSDIIFSDGFDGSNN